MIWNTIIFPAALRPVASKDEGELKGELRRGLQEALEGLEVDGGPHVAGVEQAEGGQKVKWGTWCQEQLFAIMDFRWKKG